MSYFLRAMQRKVAYRLVDKLIGRFGLLLVLVLLAGWGLMQAGILTIDLGGIWDNFRHSWPPFSVMHSLSRQPYAWGLYCY